MNKFISGVSKSPSDKRDLLITSFLTRLAIPEAITYRDEMTAIRNQGNEGSCTGHAACYLKERMEKIDYGKFIALSPRFAYEESKRISGSKEGSTMKATAQALIDKGICENDYWPYIAGSVESPKDGAYENAARFKCQAKYARITNEKELKGALVQYGPILTGVIVYKNWYRQRNGYIPNPTWWEKWQGALGGHAITICGYSDKTKEYLFINSWGPDWGDKGFGYITYAHMKSIIMDAYALIDIEDPMPYKVKTTGGLKFWQRRKRWL
jgi:C1A family cysteine protease